MPLACETLEEIEGALAEVEGTACIADPVRVLVVGERPEATPNGKRTSVVWRALAARWLSHELYLEREEDKKNG